MAISATNITDARNNLKKITDDVAEYDDQVIITKPKNKNVVVMSESEFNSWQENFLSVFETIKKDRPFIINICRSVPLDILINYLYKLVYPLIYDVVNDKAKDKVVREEDKVFIANFYKYALVSEVLEWIKNDMKEDPQIIVNKTNILLRGTIDQAINNLRKDNKF